MRKLEMYIKTCTDCPYLVGLQNEYICGHPENDKITLRHDFRPDVCPLRIVNQCPNCGEPEVAEAFLSDGKRIFCRVCRESYDLV